MKDSNLERLREIFTVILDLPPDVDPATVRQLAYPKWDSLATVSIIAAIESEFGLQMDGADMQRLGSFEAAEALLEERGL